MNFIGFSCQYHEKMRCLFWFLIAEAFSVLGVLGALVSLSFIRGIFFFFFSWVLLLRYYMYLECEELVVFGSCGKLLYYVFP